MDVNWPFEHKNKLSLIAAVVIEVHRVYDEEEKQDEAS